MKLLLESAMIFFGTLMAAGLVALGEPAANGRAKAQPQSSSLQVVTNSVESVRSWAERTSAPSEPGR